ncbi:hypothetical protein SEUCBS140593_003411 [Sporothrix eucalyptigena]|uniref:Uncharacterized protein n=1 Tax=Sporothrix eucalyptigena TaxID=1812306 RepID=A0ABP0BER4_9PEZI
MFSLLERHEAYMADAERDRAELIKRIGKLEMDKKELEAENAKKIQENRALLDQLETLNTTVSDSDTHIKMLEASLQSSQQIIRRLEGAAERAEDMERHLAVLEAEQAVLQNNLVTSESEARSAIQRWKRAERGLADLQHQLDMMEKEAREEQERHQEIMDRMERQRAIEKELNTAAGRLKGAAATKSLQEARNGAGSAVVSHFVRDLLQDNANLQLGMAELRDMLMTSNDEIQALRDQLMYHQPMIQNNASAASTLRAELETELLSHISELDDGEQQDAQETYDASNSLEAIETSIMLSTPATPRTGRHQPSLSQEFHIHHHYHVSSSGKKMETKKPRKKRAGLSPTVFTPPPAALSTPSTPLYRPSLPSLPYHQDAAASTPGSSPPSRHAHHMSRDSISTAMSGPSNRWSLFSDQPSDFSMSSVPSSPRTDPRQSVFDRTPLSDVSMPVSPTTSVDPLSPTWRSSSRMPSVDDSQRTCAFAQPLTFSSPAPQASQQMQPLSQFPEAIMEDDEPSSVLQSDTEATASNVAESDTSNSIDDVPDFTSSANGTADESVPSEATTPTPTQPSPFPNYDTLPEDNALATDEGEDIHFELPSRHHRPLHRAVSHESIISLRGGLDIHTLKARPSQLTLRPLGTAMADTGLSSITARPVISRAGPDTLKSNSMLRDSLSLGTPAPRTSRIVSSPISGTTSANASLSAVSTAAATLSGARRLGKFVAWRPWGIGTSTPTTSATTTATPVTAATAALTTAAAATPAIATTTTAVAVTAASSENGSITAPTESVTSNQPSQASGSINSATSATAAVNVPGAKPFRAAVTPKNTIGPQSAAVKAMNDLSVLRSPGINQPGAIPGFFEYWSAHQRRGAPSNVHADVVDEEALREGLLGA